MVNRALRKLASQIKFEDTLSRRDRIEFGLLCVNRVGHLLLDEDIVNVVHKANNYIDGDLSEAEFDTCIKQSEQIARSHAGTNGMDGSGNAAVSASTAVAMALAGRALDAAEYAAYASVYSYSSHSVTDQSAYQPEYQWQADQFRHMFGRGTAEK